MVVFIALSELTTLFIVGKLDNMKAKLLFKDRGQLSPQAFYEATVWDVPEPVPPSEHSFKYSLVLIENGVRVLGFDNERGKGDHKHVGQAEFDYPFVSIDQLLADFFSEVKTWIAR